MKTSPLSFVNFQIPKKSNFQPPAIALKKPEEEEVAKEDLITVNLRSNPTEATSQQYKLAVKSHKGGHVEDYLNWEESFGKILLGKNVTQGAGKYAMTRTLLAGDPLAVFNTAATELESETNANFKLVLVELHKNSFPRKSLRVQKRYMRHNMRKPFDMVIHKYVARVREINGYLDSFPPCSDGPSFEDDELLDILESQIPNAWQQAIVLQGIYPVEHSIPEFIEFCERMEFTEDLSANTKNGHKGAKQSKEDKTEKVKSKQNNRNNSDEPKSKKMKKNEQKHCPLHDSNSHDISECKVLLEKAKKMRVAYEKESPHKKDYNKKKDPEDLNVIIEKAVKKQLEKNNKKRSVRF